MNIIIGMVSIVSLFYLVNTVTVAYGQLVCSTTPNTTGSTAVIDQTSGKPYQGLRLLYVNKSIDSADYMHMSGGVLSTVNNTGNILTVTVLIYNSAHQLIATEPASTSFMNISPGQQLATYEVLLSPSEVSNMYTYIPIFKLG